MLERRNTCYGEHEEDEEVAFSVVGDIAKAPRRYKHAAEEHGYGSFGLSCASYWWTWIAACGLRLTG